MFDLFYKFPIVSLSFWEAHQPNKGGQFPQMSDDINMTCLDFLILAYFHPFWNEILGGLNKS